MPSVERNGQAFRGRRCARRLTGRHLKIGSAGLRALGLGPQRFHDFGSSALTRFSAVIGPISL